MVCIYKVSGLAGLCKWGRGLTVQDAELCLCGTKAWNYEDNNNGRVNVDFWMYDRHGKAEGQGQGEGAKISGYSGG